MIDFFIEILSIISFALTECFLWNDSLTDPGIYILPRGAITIGKMTIGQRGTSMTIIKDFMIGKALVHYSKLEPLIKNCKLVVAVNNNDESQVKALLKNKEICSVLYQNCTFKI